MDSPRPAQRRRPPSKLESSGAGLAGAARGARRAPRRAGSARLSELMLKDMLPPHTRPAEPEETWVVMGARA